MDDYKKIIQQIRNRVFSPVYLLFGEEPYFIDTISKVVEEEVLDVNEKEFNQIVLYGYDTDVQQLLGTVKRYPMMSSHLVVILKEAQMMKNIESLTSYIENPLTSTILVICHKYKKIDRRKALYKSAQKNGMAYESVKLKDYHLPNWILTYVREHGYVINEKNCFLISEHLGNDLSKISNELEKVFISLAPGSEVTTAIIEHSIGISREYNIFELQNALGAKDTHKATRIMLYFSNNMKEFPLIFIIAILYSFFSKILKLHFIESRDKQVIASQLGVNPFFVPEYQKATRNYSVQKIAKIIEHLRICDLRSKGVENTSTSHPELLKELVFKIMH